VKDFTGISAPFEAPVQADIVVTTTGREPDDSAGEIFAFTLPRIKRD
jgi:adenylylsulfate kinase-like enzyme